MNAAWGACGRPRIWRGTSGEWVANSVTARPPIPDLTLIGPAPGWLEHPTIAQRGLRKLFKALRHEQCPKPIRLLIEERLHSGVFESTSGDAFKYGLGLFGGDTREPLDELVQLGVVLQVFEERGDRHASAREYPGTAHAVRVTMDFKTGRPINHGYAVVPFAPCDVRPTRTPYSIRKCKPRVIFTLPLRDD